MPTDKITEKATTPVHATAGSAFFSRNDFTTLLVPLVSPSRITTSYEYESSFLTQFRQASSCRLSGGQTRWHALRHLQKQSEVQGPSGCDQGHASFQEGREVRFFPPQFSSAVDELHGVFFRAHRRSPDTSAERQPNSRKSATGFRGTVGRSIQDRVRSRTPPR